MAPRLILAIIACAAGAGCLPSLEPIEAWAMTLTRIRECTFVSPGAPQCAGDEALAARSVSGRWVFEHGAAQSFSVTIETGATFAGIYFADDGTGFEEPEAPCFGEGGLCYFARDRFTLADGEEGCRSGGERKIVARLSEVDGERQLEAVVSDVVQELGVVEDTCSILSQVDSIDSGTGVFQAEPSLARTESAVKPDGEDG
jgi:hypothetical protein